MSIKPTKVGIVGAGNVAAPIANALVLLGRSTSIVLFDRNLAKEEQAWSIPFMVWAVGLSWGCCALLAGMELNVASCYPGMRLGEPN